MHAREDRETRTRGGQGLERESATQSGEMMRIYQSRGICTLATAELIRKILKA